MDRIRILALDPSVNRCGYATATFTPKPGFRYPDVNAKGEVIESVAPMTWDERSSKWAWGYVDLTCLGLPARMRELCDAITMILPDGFDILIGEWPAFYDVERGHQAAMRGDLFGLAAINSYVAGYFRLPPNRVTFITAMAWKGSVAKNITMQRFLRSFGVHKIYTVDHNAVDAAMILLTWCQRTKLVSKEFHTFPKELERDKMVMDEQGNTGGRVARLW